MNIRLTTPFILLLLICFGSCIKNEEEKSANHFVVNADSSNDKAAKAIEAAMKISAIKLQMPDSVVLDATSTSLISSNNKEKIILHHDDGFFVFDRDGVMCNHFKRKGQGPEEYNVALSYAVHNDTIYVLDFTKIQMYDLNGNYLSTMRDIDGGRGQINIDSKSGNIFVLHSFAREKQLSVYNPDGTLLAELFPSKEVVRNFFIPSSPKNSMGNADGTVYVATALGQTIYSIADTTVTELATIDFGKYNLPEDFFDGSTEHVEAKFHNRRDDKNGFAYLSDVYISDNWITFTGIGIPEYMIVLADRRTGNTYTDKIFPEPLKKLLGETAFWAGYDMPTQSFAKVVPGFILAETLDAYPGSVKLMNCDTINEEDDDFVVLVALD